MVSAFLVNVELLHDVRTQLGLVSLERNVTTSASLPLVAPALDALSANTLPLAQRTTRRMTI